LDDTRRLQNELNSAAGHPGAVFEEKIARADNEIYPDPEAEAENTFYLDLIQQRTILPIY
jgi:hypothetical protein